MRLAVLVVVGGLIVAVCTPRPVAQRSPDASPRSPSTSPPLELELTTRRPSTTTTTVPPAAPTTVPSPRARADTSPPAPVDPSPPAEGDATVSSTAYCLTGTMADGAPARRGAVAANYWPLGTRLRVSPSPVGEIVTVEDRIGSGSELDFALPGDCSAARDWGRRAVSVTVVDA